MPCPFCGLIPRVIEDTQGHDFQIFCVCEAEPGFSVPKENREHAIAAWNTRPAPSPSREGWLDAETIEKWRISFKMTYTTRGHEELNALCDMALSALRPAGDEGWRPIATAPQDGSYVIAGACSGYTTTPMRCEVCQWDAEAKCWRDYSHQRFTDSGVEATHWMPLPAAPATKPTIHRDSAPDGCKWVTETKEDK